MNSWENSHTRRSLRRLVFLIGIGPIAVFAFLWAVCCMLIGGVWMLLSWCLGAAEVSDAVVESGADISGRLLEWWSGWLKP
jgi:hypothetical protein